MPQFLLLLGSLILLNSAQLVAMNFESSAEILFELTGKPIDLYTNIINAANDNLKNNRQNPYYLDSSKTLFLSADSLEAIHNLNKILLKKKPCNILDFVSGAKFKSATQKNFTIQLINTSKFDFQSNLFLKFDPTKRVKTGAGELFITDTLDNEIDLSAFKKAKNDNRTEDFWHSFLGKEKISHFQRPTVTGLSLFAAVGIGMCGLFAWRNREAIKGFSYSTILSRFFGLFTKKRAAV